MEDGYESPFKVQIESFFKPKEQEEEEMSNTFDFMLDDIALHFVHFEFKTNAFLSEILKHVSRSDAISEVPNIVISNKLPRVLEG